MPGSKGDFLVGDTVIHVSVAPNENLIKKCCENLVQNFRPLVITTRNGADGAIALAGDVNIAERIDVLEIEQFVATNVHEWSAFQQTKRSLNVRQLVEAYNRIIDECETDPSLRIIIG